ncbi:2-methylisocitrate lyase [compost metagenome]
MGINIEDTIVVNGKREFLATADFKGTIEIFKSQLRQKNIDIFLNARTDAFLMGIANPLPETITRMKAYEEAGADGIFVPCVTATADIQQLVNTTKLPLNVLCMPDLPDFKTLKDLGVKRISSGNALHDYQTKSLNSIIKQIRSDQSFSSLN